MPESNNFPPEYTIFIAADHRGFQKKEELFPLLNECHENVHAEDLGPDNYDENDDYNDAAIAVAKAVLAENAKSATNAKNPENAANAKAHETAIGVLICGSAHGVTMQANRFKGIRAVNVDSVESAKHARTNDYANVICLSADYLDLDTMENLIKTFCHTQPIPSENYQRRAAKLDLDYDAQTGDHA